MATSWTYEFVVLDGYIYEVTEELVTEIGNKIGQDTKYSDMEQIQEIYLMLIRKVLNTIQLKVLVWKNQ